MASRIARGDVRLYQFAPLKRARLSLVAAARQVLANGLSVLGVSAPERM